MSRLPTYSSRGETPPSTKRRPPPRERPKIDTGVGTEELHEDTTNPEDLYDGVLQTFEVPRGRLWDGTLPDS